MRPLGVALLKLAASGPLYAQSRGVQEVVRRFYSPEQAITAWARKTSKHHRLSLLQQIEQGYITLAFDRLRNIKLLNKRYGFGKWRKRKGVALIRLKDGSECLAELHWYEASGFGRKEMKVKWLLN